MCEIIDFLGPGEKGLDDNLSPEAAVVPWALAGYSELMRQDLCAELTTLNLYGLSGVGCALVDGLSALVVRSKHAIRVIGGSVPR